MSTPRRTARYVLLAAIAIPLQAAAQPHDVILKGVAQTGSVSRPVRFHFSCSANDGPNLTGALSVQLEVPQVEQLAKVFDFAPFEGPDAHAGALSQLDVSAARAKAQATFTASGYYPPDPPDSFMLEISAARRPVGNARLKSIAATLHALIDGPARLTWRQGNANRTGVPLVAILDLPPADAEQLKSALGPCLSAK